MRITYYKELDGVRAIAALMVMVFHFFQQAAFAGTLVFRLSLFGQTGVSLFFVLSGFLITRILMSTKAEPGYFSNFYIRRVLRIFPLYYLFLCIAYFIVPLATGTAIPAFRLQVFDWTYMQDFARTFNWKFEGPEHFWSLAIEEHFYLFWPLLVFYLNRKGIRIAIWLIVASAFFLVRFWLVREHFEVYYFTFTRMDELALGALLATMEKDIRSDARSSSRFLWGFAAVMVPTLAIWSLFTGSANAIVQVFKFNLISLSYFCLIGYVVTMPEGHRLKRLLKTSFFSYTGKISYGLYVYHPLCFWLFSLLPVAHPFLVDLAGSFATAYLMAGLSYHFFEERFLKLKKHFEFKRVATPQLAGLEHHS